MPGLFGRSQAVLGIVEGDYGGPQAQMPLSPCSGNLLICSVSACKQSPALNKPPLSVSWESQPRHRCQLLMLLSQVGFQLSTPMACSFCLELLFGDGNNGSSRWGLCSPISSSHPSRRQGRSHLEGEGQIIKTHIMTLWQALICQRVWEGGKGEG